jgi:hypothetical protein
MFTNNSILLIPENSTVNKVVLYSESLIAGLNKIQRFCVYIYANKPSMKQTNRLLFSVEIYMRMPLALNSTIIMSDLVLHILNTDNILRILINNTEKQNGSVYADMKR